MDEKNLKGDYLKLEEGSTSKTVYLSQIHEEELNQDDIQVSGEDEEMKSIATFNHDEFEGRIINTYKNNLVVEVDSKYAHLIKESENIRIRITKEKNAYECFLKVLGLKNEGENFIIVLSIPVIERKVDRRRFFRINLKFMIRYCLIPKGEYHTLADIPKGCFLKIKKTYTYDISGGGASIICNENCEGSKYVLLCVYLPNKIDILCEIVRIAPYSNKGTQVIICMKFIDINEADRDKVVGFVIKNEIYRRNKNREK